MTVELSYRKTVRRQFRFYPEDDDCVRWMRERYSLPTNVEAVRLALRLWRDFVEGTENQISD